MKIEIKVVFSPDEVGKMIQQYLPEFVDLRRVQHLAAQGNENQTEEIISFQGSPEVGKVENMGGVRKAIVSRVLARAGYTEVKPNDIESIEVHGHSHGKGTWMVTFWQTRG